MPRNITVTFEDGTTHVYQNAPDDVTPAQVEQRALGEFGKKVTALDGGRQTQPAPAAPKPSEIPGPRRSFGQELMRQAGLTARYIPEGLADVAGIVTEPVRAVGEALGLPKTPSLRQGVSGALTAAGLPQPETGAERVVGDISRALAGGGGIIKGAQAGTSAAARQLASAPALQGVTTAAGAGAAGATREAGGGPGAQMLAGLAAGAAPLALSPAAKAAGWAWDARGGKLVQRRAGKILREIAGDKLDEVRAALAAASPDTTAGQAVAGAGVNAPTFQAMERQAAAKMPEQFQDIYRGQEAARLAALQGVTPDLAAAEAARAQAAKFNYGAAEAVDAARLGAIQRQAQAARAAGAGGAAGAQPIPSPVTPQLEALRQTPAIRAAIDVVRREAPQLGDPLGSVQGLHLMKLAIDQRLRNPSIANQLQGYTEGAINQARAQLLGATEQVSPFYGAARREFAQMSEPVNQAMVLNRMTEVLQKPGGGERVTPFLNALGSGEQALLKRATGYPRHEAGDLAQVLSSKQMSTVQRVASELTRDAEMARQAKQGATRLGDIIGESNVVFQAPNPLRAEVTLFNRVAELLQNKINSKTLKVIQDAMMSAKTTEQILNTVPAGQRSAVAQALQRAGTEMRAAAATNALVQGAATQNALVE